MERWISPLKKQMIVTCTNGLQVETLDDPVWREDEGYYDILVRVLDSGSSNQSRGEEDVFRHSSPTCFKRSIFLKIEPAPLTLEQEYYERIAND